MMTARALAADYPVATAPADFVIKAPAEWTRVQCAVFDDKIIVLAAGDGLFDGNGTAKNATFTVVVTPIAPYSLTSPAPPAPLAPGGTGQVTVTYEGGGQDSLVETFEFKKPEGRTLIRLFVVPVKLQSIGFGNTIGDLQRDDGTTYESPQWQDGNLDNVVLPGSADPGEDADRNYPVGFVRTTKPKLTDKTVLKLGGPLPHGITLYLGAESDPNGIKIDAAMLQVDASHQATLVAAPVESAEALHDSINYYDAGASAPGRIFEVDWKVRVGGGSFLSVAETRHTLYKTAAMPLLGEFGLRESMVYYACYGARQADPGSTQSIADSIQERVFSTKQMSQVNPCLAEMMGAPFLKYSESYSDGYLPEKGGGQCGGWSGLFRDCVRIHGRSDITKVRLDIDQTQLFDVPFPEIVDAVPTAWLVRDRVALGPGGSKTKPAPNPSVDGGQGNAHTLDWWGGHSIAGIQGTAGALTRFYDPSYGSGPFQNMEDYEGRGIACFFGEVTPGGFFASYTYYWPNRNIPEIIATPDPTP